MFVKIAFITYPAGPSLHYPALGQFGRTQIKLALQDKK
jgi:hypothetical protein